MTSYKRLALASAAVLSLALFADSALALSMKATYLQTPSAELNGGEIVFFDETDNGAGEPSASSDAPEDDAFRTLSDGVSGVTVTVNGPTQVFTSQGADEVVLSADPVIFETGGLTKTLQSIFDTQEFDTLQDESLDVAEADSSGSSPDSIETPFSIAPSTDDGSEQAPTANFVLEQEGVAPVDLLTVEIALDELPDGDASSGGGSTDGSGSTDGGLADGGSIGGNVEVSPIPLPATLPLMAAGLGALGAVARKRRKAT